jgi:hypothetical protein
MERQGNALKCFTQMRRASSASEGFGFVWGEKRRRVDGGKDIGERALV